MDSKRRFIEAGGNLQHKRVKRILEDASTRARREAEKLTAPPNAFAAEWIRRMLGWLAIAFFTVALVIGVGALLIIIPAAEFAAVHAGLATITPDKPAIAILTTAALFIGIIVLMFLRHVYEDALPNGRPSTGLRRYAAVIGSWLGFKRAELWYIDRWTKVERDYVALTTALHVSEVAVLLASLLGRLHVTVTAHADKPVGEALESIRNNLTGQELIGAVTSLLLLYGILLALNAGVLFAYTAFKNSAGALDLAETRPLSYEEYYEQLREEYQTAALNDLTLQLEAANQEPNS